jgi:hypothetical protein
MNFRLQMQLAEALGHVNRWYCSQAHRRQIDDPELLMVYFIKSGGAADFDRRFKQAIGPLNRYYCSEFHQSDIRDQKLLWDHFVQYGQSTLGGTDSNKHDPGGGPDDHNIFC